MKKNVYSLVLSEGVVNAVDALAYREGTNRSALINRILAEYVSYTTPEMRMREVLYSIESLLSASAFRLMPPSESMISMRSSLAYKYNPTVRYSVELYREGDAIGALRVSLRTQNEALTRLMNDFYKVFASIEEKYIGENRYEIIDGRFLRLFRLRTNRREVDGMVSTEGLGALISRYIQAFDRAMKEYFALLETPSRAIYTIDAIYRQYLCEAEEII